MMNVSKEFRNLVKSGVNLVNYADITLKDGTVLNLGPSDFSVGGFSLKDETGSTFGVGNVIGKTTSVKIANHTNKFSTYDFYKAIFYMYVSATTEDGRILKERKGKYYAINPVTPGDVINLSGVDSMYLFDKPYDAPTKYPATLQDILSDCCIACGVKIGFGQFNNYNFEVLSRPEDCTYREVVSWVCQIAGYNARISNDDALELVWYDTSLFDTDSVDGGNFLLYEEAENYDGGDFSFNTGDVLDGGNFTDPRAENVTRINSLNVSTDDVIITGVKVEYDNTVALAGTEDYVISIKNNPLTESIEQEVANILFARVGGIKTRPLTCQIPNNPLWEPFDVCTVYDRKGNGYNTLINSVNYTISGFTTLACKAEDMVRNESSYSSPEARAVAQARRNTERQFTTYENAVLNMNELAANAMGLFRDSDKLEDGSVIYYMSNRPITKDENGNCVFEENSVVFKMTGDGFFVSEDGGLSYAAGIDSNGNAVVNVLSAIGIQFDWARGGTLSLGGFDNANGVIKMYDKDGNQVGYWSNNEFYVIGTDYKPAEYEKEILFDIKESYSSVITQYYYSTLFTLSGGLSIELSNSGNHVITIKCLSKQYTAEQGGYEETEIVLNLSGKNIFVDSSVIGYYYMTKISVNNAGIISLKTNSVEYRANPIIESVGNNLNFSDGSLTIGKIRIEDGLYINNKAYGTSEILSKEILLSPALGYNSTSAVIDIPLKIIEKYSFIQISGITTDYNNRSDLLFASFSTMNPYSLITQELGGPPSYTVYHSNDTTHSISISISKTTVEGESYIRFTITQSSNATSQAKEKEIVLIGIV